MEDFKGGNSSINDVPGDTKSFEIPQFPNQLFAIGTSNFAQQPAPLPSTSRAVAPKKPASPKRIPRPMNAFMIFSNENRTEMRKRFPLLQNKELSKRLGAVWRKLNKEEQDIYYRKAKLASEDHRRKYPDYHYRPRGRGPNAPEKLNKNVNKNVAGTMPFVAVQSPGGLLTAATLNSLPSPNLAPSFMDVSHLGIEAPPNAQQSNQNAAVVRNNNTNNRRPRNRPPAQLTLPNMTTGIHNGAQDALKQPTFFGEGSSNALAAVTNFYQQYLAYGPNDYNQLTGGKTLTMPAAMLGDNGSSRVPGPAHSNNGNSSYKQVYSNDANLQVTGASWLPSLSLGGANVPYAAHQSFPLFLLNQQGGKSVPANPYLQNVAWRQQNMPSGFDTYLRLTTNVGDPATTHVQSINGASSGSYQTYLTPPPSHAGSTSSVSSPPFSAESSQSNCSIVQQQNELSASQHSIPTPLPSQFSGGSVSSRLFFPSSSSQVHDADGRRSCQTADLSTTEADEQTNFGGSWDTSNMDPMSYESSVTPGFYSDGGMTSSQQQNHSVESGFLMPDLADEQANDAMNMSSTGYNGYTTSSTTESWRDMASSSTHQQQHPVYMGQQTSQLVYAASPLALKQHQRQSTASNNRQLSSDLRAFPDEMLNSSGNSASQNGSGNVFNFNKSFSDPAYAEAFSVSTAATSADDLDDHTCDFEDDRLLNFNFSCDDNGVPASCVNDMLSTDGNGLGSYGNFVENSGTSRWDFHDDLNDVEPTAAPSASTTTTNTTTNTVAELSNCRTVHQSSSSSPATAECALLEAAGL